MRAQSEAFPQVPLGRLGRLLKGYGGTKADAVDEGVPCIRYGDLYTQHKEFIVGARSFLNPETAKGYFRLHQGDVLFAASGETLEDIGRSAEVLIEGEAYCGGDTIVFRPSQPFAPKFLGYALDSTLAKGAKAQMGRGYTVVHIYPTELKHLPVPLPPFEEQRSIAAFLDHETARIDELVREQERLADLAGQKRTASIREITHFGPSQGVELQSTGIEWIPQIPAHWRLSKIGFEARVGNGSTPARENTSYWQDGDVAWMNSSKINEVFITGADQFVTQKALRECHLPKVPANSVLIAITGEGRTRGLSAITKIDTTINQHLAYVSVTSGAVLPEYLRYYLEGQYEHLRYESSGTGSTRAALTCGFIQKYPVPVPPIAEQKAIVDVLDRDLSRLSGLVENAETMKQLLLERRAALITAVVTGQLDVRDWRPSEAVSMALEEVV